MDLRTEAIKCSHLSGLHQSTTDPSSGSFGRIGGPGNQARILQFAVDAHF